MLFILMLNRVTDNKLPCGTPLFSFFFFFFLIWAHQLQTWRLLFDKKLIMISDSLPFSLTSFRSRIILSGCFIIFFSVKQWNDFEFRIYWIFTPTFFKWPAMSTWSRKFWKNRIQDSLVFETKTVRRQNKLNSFGNLIGQCTHVPVVSTTSTRFEFVPCKNESYVWSRSRDMDSCIYFTVLTVSFSHTVTFSQIVFVLGLSCIQFFPASDP